MKNKSAIFELSRKIFEISVKCTREVERYLEKKYPKDSEEYQVKYIGALFEFMYFFMHITNGAAFHQLGQERRNKLIDELGPLLIDTTIETLLGDWPQDLRDEIRNGFYGTFNSREIEYSKCKELLVKPEDDISTLERYLSGGFVKSKGLITLLVDNLGKAITGEISMNADFHFRITHMVIGVLKSKKKEIDNLVLKISKKFS